MDLAEKLPKWTYLAHQTTQWARTVLCHCCCWKAAEGWFQGLLSPPKTVLHPWLISDSEVNWITNRPFHASRIYTVVFYRRTVVQSTAHMGWAVEWWYLQSWFLNSPSPSVLLKRLLLWRRKWQPTPGSCLGESHEQRSLAGYRNDWSDLARHRLLSDQIRSVAQSCPTLRDPMNCSTPGLPVHHQLPEFTQTHVHRVSDAIQPSHSLSSPSPQSLPASESYSLACLGLGMIR